MAVEKALEDLKLKMKEIAAHAPITFDEFIQFASDRPNNVFRNVFQMFSDMIYDYIGKGYDQYPDDPDSINFINYDCSRLFVDGSDNPFFADTPFANRLVNLSKAFRAGTQRNKIFIFEGPAGSGKSTFLNNLLLKLEEYNNTDNGLTFEIVWKLDKKQLGGVRSLDEIARRHKTSGGIFDDAQAGEDTEHGRDLLFSSDILEVACPNHDNPILIIPKHYRRSFFQKIIKDNEFKKRLFNRKEFEWVFKDDLCTICTSLYQTLLDKLGSPARVLKMLYARKYQFNRRLGEGVTVYSPGDKVIKEALTNTVLQRMLNTLLHDSNAVHYIFSEYARTNNGIYSIMDVKSNNKERFMNLHGIISDSIHKVEHIEERVDSLFITLMNPEDKDVVESVKSFGDRVMRIPIPYVLDYHTEVEIYFKKFGREITEKFLPRVLDNFAKVVISSRLNRKSENMIDWINDPKKYTRYCDEDLLLLKMELYTGRIPSWIAEEDRKSFTAKRRKKIISESEKEGLDENSISGRKSIELFSEFYSKYAKNGSLTDMSKIYKFFEEKREEFRRIPREFLESLVTLYNYNVLQEIKQSLYSYNDREIAKEIMNYLFAINFDLGTSTRCVYTGEDIEITEDSLSHIETKLLGRANKDERSRFREYVQKEYTSKTLPAEIGGGKNIKQTSLFNLLLEKYQHHLKEDVLNPFLENDNFRNAIRDYGTPAFKSYDKKIIKDVRFLMRNLKRNHQYTEEGSKQICIYVIDNDIPKTFVEE